jgi:hypothetical protein
MKKVITINREKVQEALDDAILGEQECYGQDDEFIYAGWVEALEFILKNKEK